MTSHHVHFHDYLPFAFAKLASLLHSTKDCAERKGKVQYFKFKFLKAMYKMALMV